MNKKTILAFLLILVTFAFFYSPLYYKLIHQPYPFDAKKSSTTLSIKQSVDKQNNLLTSPTDTFEKAKPSALVATTSFQQQNQASFKTIKVTNGKLVCSITEKGAQISSIEIKDFKYTIGNKAGQVIQLIDSSIGYGANLTLDNKSYDNSPFKYSGDSNIIINSAKSNIDFVCIDSNGLSITKRFVFEKNSYKIGLEVLSAGLKNRKITYGWKPGVSESEYSAKPSKTNPLKTDLHYSDGKTVYIENKKAGETEDLSGNYNWIGVSSKYFLISMVTDTLSNPDFKFTAFALPGIDPKQSRINYSLQVSHVATSDMDSIWCYTGPTQIDILKQYHVMFEKVLFKGYAWFFFADKWFPPLCDAVLWLLGWLFLYTKDYGFVILILTLILKLVTFPLTQSSMTSMKKMAEIQPELNKVREKYKNKPQIMNQKLMEYYKENNINPLAGIGGCLPMVIQMPIMISLYIVLNKAIELREHTTLLVPWIKDLTQPEVFFKMPFGWEIPFYGSSVALLPILMAILMYFQNKMTIKDPNQKAMIWMMPIIMLVMFNNFPAGLSLYFVFSSFLQLLQQLLTNGLKPKK